MRKLAARTLVLLAVAAPLRAAEVRVSTSDGLALGLDTATGQLGRVEIDGLDYADAAVRGGLYVRDREHLTDLPPGSPNSLPNPSFEIDSDKDGMPDGWTFYDGGYAGATLSWDLDPWAGARSVTIHDKSGGQLVTTDVTVDPGRRYLIQAHVKGASRLYIYVVWKAFDGSFIFYELAALAPASPLWHPVHLLVTAPQTASLADVWLQSADDGGVTIDEVRMDDAPPNAFSLVPGPVVATGNGARQTATLAALGVDVDAQWQAAGDHVAVDVKLVDRTGKDRALEAGLVLPVLPQRFWDTIHASRMVTQQNYAETFSYTYWGRIYNDGPWGQDRSVYPFAAVTVGPETGLAMGYDVSRGPMDARFFYSTYTGESFTSLFRLGIAPEPARFPRETQFHLLLFRADGPNAFRGALDRYYQLTSPTFDNRLPVVGGWTFRDLARIPGPQDFGLAIHSWDQDVAGDDARGVLSFGYMPGYDYWLPLGDFTAQPTAQDAIDRIAFNATDPSVAADLKADARAQTVSGARDAAGNQVLAIYQESWMPGSGWSAVCANDPDPEVVDTTNGWASRYALNKAQLDARFANAQSAGAKLDGAFLDWFRSNLNDSWNHRRSHWTSCDTPPSFDPATLTPALPESFAHWEAAMGVAQDMRAKGLFTMARDIHFPSFWATSALDVMGEELGWKNGAQNEDDADVLGFFRTVAGRKPYVLMLDADFSTYDVAHALRRTLLYGLFLSPYWDSTAQMEYWDETAFVERDRPLFRKFVPLLRLESDAGWQPATGALAADPAVLVERWGSAPGTILLSAWNSGAADATDALTVDLAALQIAPAKVGRVVDLVEKGAVGTTPAGSKLQIRDTLAPDAARLYHLHVKGSGGPGTLYAVKKGTDVRLTWTTSGSAFFEVMRSARRDLQGASIDLAQTPSWVDAGGVPAAGPAFYSVE